MLLKSFIHQLARLPSKIPLRAILVVPFLIQLFATVGLTGWLAFRNGQQSVDDLTTQLSNEITQRIHQRLDTYLSVPQLINQTNANDVRLGKLSLQDPLGLEQHFWRQIQLFDAVSYIYFGSQDEVFFSGAERTPDGEFYVAYWDENAPNSHFSTYETDSEGNRTKLVSAVPYFNMLQRPWYKAAVEAGRPAWGDIYVWAAPYANLALPAVLPFYSTSGELEGVFAVDLSLLDISSFLRTLEVGKTGQTFVVDRDGFLVASSASTPPFRVQDDQHARLAATEIDQPLIHGAAEQIRQTIGDFAAVVAPQQLKFEIEGNPHLAQVTPLSDELGLDWLIVVVVAEDDFMQRIHAGNRLTILLCLGSLALATGLGLLTARWITKPILQLSQASQAIAEAGPDSKELNRSIQVRGSGELRVLARSFNLMAEQLQKSFTILERTNEELEQRVEERTRALRLTELKFSKAFRSTPDAITISTLDTGQFIEVNNSFSQLTGYSTTEAVGSSSLELGIWLDPMARSRMLEQFETNDAVRNYEFELLTKTREVRQCLLSAEIVSLDGHECLLAVTHDITELKQVEEALREKEEYLRLILDNIPQQVFWKDTNLLFRGCNKNWAESIGIDDPEAVVGKTDYDLLLDREAAEFYRAQDRRIMRTRQAELHQIEQKLREDTKEPMWLDVSRLPIFDAEGRPIGVLGVSEDITQRKQAEEALRAEQQKSEQLLRNILPKPIVEQLKQSLWLPSAQGTQSLDIDRKASAPIASAIAEATILFADIVDFTPLASKLAPGDLVNLLSEIFSEFDQLAEEYELEKIKTIGDEYMVAGGLPVARPDHAEAIAEMALAMQDSIQRFQREDGRPFQLRIGINTGPVIAGVIGMKKFIYDLWGDAVNVASRMEVQGQAGNIQVTAATYARLEQIYLLEERGSIEVKGKGKMMTYWLRGRKL